MPKLNDKMAKKVAAQEGGSFEALPAGVYIATLLKVDVKEGAAGPYWRWTYRVDEPEQFANRQLFTNTSLAEGALWKVNETFKAFGVPTNTDTDEMCGETVKLIVSTAVIQSGNRKGEMGNNIDRVMPVKPSKASANGRAKAKADDDDEPDDDEPEEKPARSRAAAGTKAKAKPADDEDEDEDPF